MSEFNHPMCRFFGAEKGAYSPVTEREATGDKSVTTDTDEKGVLFDCYPAEGFTRRGGAAPDGKKEDWEVVVHTSTGHTYASTVVILHPKKFGTELRLYFSRTSNFYPETGDIWFIYTSMGSLHIGFKKKNEWDALFSDEISDEALAYMDGLNIDDEDDQYQAQIGAAAVKLPVSKSGMTYPRDGKIGLRAAQAAGFLCEINREHKTFISSKNGNPFIEGHHLIPVSAQKLFEQGLDVEENVVCLCPICHRAIHHAEPETKADLIRQLYTVRQERLAARELHVSFGDILSIYGLTEV
jgi:5-methylcytosine-specific restriction protein A